MDTRILSLLAPLAALVCLLLFVQRRIARRTRVLLLEQSGLNGTDEDRFALGEMFENGDGTKPDMAKAIAWYTSAARWGYLPAILRLREIYAEGRGTIERDQEKARSWLLRAAELGHGPSQLALAKLDETGSDGVTEAPALERDGEAQDAGSAEADESICPEAEASIRRLRKSRQ